jgi:hypothetical protein
MTYLIPQLPSAGGGVTLQSSWRFSTDVTATDPGNKTIKFDNATLADVTEIYVSSTTNENGDANTILGLLVAGNRMYVQQQDDASRAVLFELRGPPVDNTGWWTIPVTVINSLALMASNKTAAVIITLGGDPDPPLIALRQASVLRVNSTTMIDDTVLTLPLEATTVYKVEMSLRFNRLAGAPASSLKFNFNNTFGLTQGSLHGESTLLNVHGADYNVIPDNAAGDTVLDPVILGVQYRWIARGVIVTAGAGNWVLEFAQNVATTTAVSLIAGSYLKAIKIGTES